MYCQRYHSASFDFAAYLFRLERLLPKLRSTTAVRPGSQSYDSSGATRRLAGRTARRSPSTRSKRGTICASFRA
jgi:hypothetical protein